MKHVLLLRAPAEEGSDGYETACEARGYAPLSVPVLETVIVNLEGLTSKISAGPQVEGLSGVIITSKRAIEAWRKSIEEIVSQNPHTQNPDSLADWRQVPFYVVGDATALAASKIQASFPSYSRLAPADIRGGSQSGTAERLARFILEGLPSEDGERKKLLYLTGDKNRDTLSQILSSSGNIDLDALEVYRTTGSSSFRSDLKAAMEKKPIGDWGWVIYFAPSAAEFVTPFLCDVFQLGTTAQEFAGKPPIKIAAIGPTTATFLQDTLKLPVNVVASKPTPDELVSAIFAVDNA
ncbi:hypothetical protein HYDPIDRAFT_90635 [Hydnomerulius pinastri MD-312]|uniref:Unplaced genomic scaffold scaffold_13, whole genome shotgun sequence n=1 Tax=Hydnomerulius pinastri MD-312 TaxID=994086 RepID=A0A0C9WEX8_9AGAM|nr:hypothetical protein HYDPIDRAFT_90635 [Hydnomerulius pinastri MD-312]